MLLELHKVRKRFGRTLALDDVSAEVDGRAVGLLGPNGAGKTTLMRICLGLLSPDTGRVKVLGINALSDSQVVRSRLGYTSEGSGRVPGLSGLESVAFMAELCGLRRRKALLRAHEVLDLVGLDESRHRPVETYSTGMHQRVKVAMALVHDPDLLLLDEPTSGLDPQSRDELLELVVQLRDGEGPAVLLSTHLLHDVERTCDACVIMKEGRVLYSGNLDELKIQHSREFELRLASLSAPFIAALKARGAEVREEQEMLFVRPPGAAGVELIWEAAEVSASVVIHMEARAARLEDAFLSRIGAQP